MHHLEKQRIKALEDIHQAAKELMDDMDDDVSNDDTHAIYRRLARLERLLKQYDKQYGMKEGTAVRQAIHHESGSMKNKMVRIRRLADGEDMREFGPHTEDTAERIADGASINLNRNDYEVVIEDV